jgi:hypothetical protein
MPNELFKIRCIADGSMPVVVYLTSVLPSVSTMPSHGLANMTDPLYATPVDPRLDLDWIFPFAILTL